MKTRKSIYIEDSLHAEIEEIAKRDNRAVNSTICILLQQAVKERTRKRNAKKVHIQNNSAD